MAKNKFRSPFHIGAHVEDMSGIIGTITGPGKWVGSVTVDFGNGCTRDLFTDKLKPARYTPQQIQAMESEAVQMYETLDKIRKAQAISFIPIWDDVLTCIQRVERKFPCPTPQKQRG